VTSAPMTKNTAPMVSTKKMSRRSEPMKNRNTVSTALIRYTHTERTCQGLMIMGDLPRSLNTS